MSDIHKIYFAETLPIAAANYVEAGSELKVKVEVAYPIKTVEELQSKTIVQNPIAVSL